eukprot:6250347-Amphidinium_carterae.1
MQVKRNAVPKATMLKPAALTCNEALCSHPKDCAINAESLTMNLSKARPRGTKSCSRWTGRNTMIAMQRVRPKAFNKSQSCACFARARHTTLIVKPLLKAQFFPSFVKGSAADEDGP